jgi:hypothetical protein
MENENTSISTPDHFPPAPLSDCVIGTISLVEIEWTEREILIGRIPLI